MILALVVVIAVLIFGALISLRNELQRKAIEGLREQAALWAVQDIKIKREKLARDVKVEDPLAWLNLVFAKLTGKDLTLEMYEIYDKLQALVCRTGNGGRVIFTPISPSIMKDKSKRDRLSKVAVSNPLFSLPRGTQHYEVSVLSAGILFDLELCLAWKALTGEYNETIERLWIYILPK